MIIKWQSRNITMHKFITPRVGSDVTLIILTLITTKFQSTLPVWGATHTHRHSVTVQADISIHAPRVGSDWCT